ncbi:DMT family transporter [Leptolyngbya cf. ectocarpi LEGE 11479]|uniref:DMT family transporter n=1 Tax=Leptolyngbya cf. ectocarpi LEGE 11479 TaxID=1828722 RepID=A0A929FCW3_LEPEC|nr:DMT family transporter [Leptolyngbya ectocarpi]MBE9070419.1 DMT family transporter [Leptolyngbya cf. ectocarpi LEGE 11479]
MGLLLICLAAVAWGTTGTTSVLIAQQATLSPLIVGLYRIVFALPVFWLWHGYNARQKSLASWLFPPKHRLSLLAMGLCMAGYQVFYFAAVPYIGVAMTALVAVCSSPLIIALLAIAFLGEKLTRSLCIALALGVTGTVLLIAQPEAVHVDGVRFFLGVVLAFGAAFSYAGYAIFAKSLVGRMDAIAIATYSFTVAALILTPTLVLHPPLGVWLKTLPLLLYLGVITGGLAYGIYMLGIRHTSATMAGLAVLLEPLTASLLGIFAFKEPISGSGAVGAVLLIVGILCAQKGNATKHSKSH